MKHRAVFLDRDGVLTRTEWIDGVPRSPLAADEMEIVPGVTEACARLVAADLLLVVVTNQPDVARGRLRQEEVDLMHQRLASQLPLHDIRVCCHDDSDSCACRKPKPGMLILAANTWNIDLPRSFMVGDRDKDMKAGKAAGCTTILVGGHRGEICPDHEALDLQAAVDIILNSLNT